MLENEHVKMSWDFECNIRTKSAARRPDLAIEYKERKLILYCAQPVECLAGKSAYRYRLKGGTTINHLLYMDDIKQ